MLYCENRIHKFGPHTHHDKEIGQNISRQALPHPQALLDFLLPRLDSLGGA